MSKLYNVSVPPEKYKAPTVPYMTGNIQILQKSEENQKVPKFLGKQEETRPKTISKEVPNQNPRQIGTGVTL